MDDFEKNAREMRDSVYAHMLARHRSKYLWFLRGLRAFKYASLSPTRGTFLESYYTVMRYIDDVVDGDAPLPKSFGSTEEFVLDKIAFSKRMTNPCDPTDHLLAYCYELGSRFGSKFEEETSDILSSMLFDAQRNWKFRIFPEAVLKHHFYLLDVRGTIKAALKVFREDPAKFENLRDLGTATRIHYNLHDFRGDVMKLGQVNIPAEYLNAYGFGVEELQGLSDLRIQSWYLDQAREGLGLLDDHNRTMQKSKYRWITRAALFLYFEKPARDYFQKVIESSGAFGLYPGDSLHQHPTPSTV